MSRKKGCSPKRATRKRYVNPLFDDHGHPNPQDEWESMLPEIKAGRLLRKRCHETPRLDDIDPNFGEKFDEAKHGQMLKDELNISHLSVHQQNVLCAFIINIGDFSAKRALPPLSKIMNIKLTQGTHYCAPARLSPACARNVGIVTDFCPPDLVGRFCVKQLL